MMRAGLMTLLSILCATSATASADRTASAVGKAISAHGAKVANNRLSDDQFDHAIRAARDGNSVWLQLLAALYPGTDAGRAEAILFALSDGLQTNPRAVLSIMEAHAYLGGPAALCVDRQIEPSLLAAQRFRIRAMEGVRRVHEPRLSALRDRCLASLAR